jgi:membrane-associated phospholipid phosphatase
MSMLHESTFISEHRVPLDRAWSWKRACMVVAFLGVVMLQWCCAWDTAAVDCVRTSAHGFWRRLAEQVSVWGDWYGVLSVGCVLWIWAKARKSVAIQHLIRVMALSAVLAGVTANVIRAATGRTRPFAVAVQGWHGPLYGIGLRGSGHDFQSFPSAHTAVVAGFVAPLGWISLRVRRGRARALGTAAALAAMGTMAWARVWCGGHHISDVLASCILGILMGALLIKKSRLPRDLSWKVPFCSGAEKAPVSALRA